MSNSDKQFNTFRNLVFKEAIESSNEENKPSRIRLGLAILGVTIFVGSAAIKAVFRKNFTVSRENMIQFILCFMVILGVGIFSLSTINASENYSQMGNSDSFFIVGIMSIILAFYILFKGIKYRIFTIRLNQVLDSEGESIFFKFLLKGKKRLQQKEITNIAEPLIALAVGVLFLFFNLLAAITIIACALSVWLYLLKDLILGKKDVHEAAIRMNQKNNNSGAFHETKTNF